MTLRGVTMLLVATVILVAVFGLCLMLLAPVHGSGCPLMITETALCRSSVIEHISLWQTMFASILLSLALGIGFGALTWRRAEHLVVAHEHIRYRMRRLPEHPTLFQELFSHGILHSKAF